VALIACQEGIPLIIYCDDEVLNNGDYILLIIKNIIGKNIIMVSNGDFSEVPTGLEKTLG